MDEIRGMSELPDDHKLARGIYLSSALSSAT